MNRVLVSVLALGVLFTSCRMRPPTKLTSPGHEREEARRAESRSTEFLLRCPEGAPRTGRGCGLLAYHWFSDAHVATFRRERCPAKIDDDCATALFREYHAAVHRRYAAVDVGVPDRACSVQQEPIDCMHPLLSETLYLTAHNLTRERFPDAVYEATSGADAMESRRREEAIVKELSELVQRQLRAVPPGLPSRTCPQRVIGGVECEGQTRLLAAPWRSRSLVLELE